MFCGENAVSHLGLCYLYILPFLDFLLKCINHVPAIAYTEYEASYTPANLE